MTSSLHPNPPRAIVTATAATALSVLWLSDGKPGHFTLSEAIIAGLSRRRETIVTRVEVRRPWWLPPRVLSALVNARLPLPPGLLGLDLAGLPRAHVIVSAGGDTLAANVLAARHLGSPNVFYGSLRRYRPDDFTLVLTSYAEHETRPNTVMTLKPCARDPDAMPRPAAIPGQPTPVGLLIGGDSGTIGYGARDWDRLIGLAAAAGSEGIALTVANSRRTPGDVSDRLAALAAGGAIRFIDVRTAGPGTLGPLFAASRAIVATVDSSTMISEAVWARRPVIVLTPERWSLPALERNYRAYMERHGWTATLPLGDATPRRILDQSATLVTLASNPLEELALLLDRRLGLATM